MGTGGTDTGGWAQAWVRGLYGIWVCAGHSLQHTMSVHPPPSVQRGPPFAPVPAAPPPPLPCTGMKKAFATRLCGSADLYQTNQRKPFHSINFVIAHDGFSLHDLVVSLAVSKKRIKKREKKA